MAEINFENLPVEPTVTLVSPDGTDLITTNNPIAILFARLEIKHHRWSGYQIRTSKGFLIDIKSNGKLSTWPEGELPGDVLDKLTQELI